MDLDLTDLEQKQSHTEGSLDCQAMVSFDLSIWKAEVDGAL